MTEKLIVSNWLADRKKLSIQTFIVEGIEFEIMALTESLKDDLESCLSYKEMLFFAADSGVSCNRRRVADDPELAKDLNILWGEEIMDLDLDPCIRHRVGDKVCEISGLSSYIEAVFDTEVEAAEAKAKAEAEAELIKVGDHELPGDTLIDNLNQESLDADAAEYVSAT